MKTALRSFRMVTFSALLTCSFTVQAQTSSKSLLINHGSTACGNWSAEQQFFSSALGGTPTALYSGSNGLPYGGTFTAYNPVDQKVYFADINGGITRVYAMDYNFGGTMATPSAATATYTYNYTLNQLCFDNDGNNYGFKSFDPANGKAKITKVDIATGDEIGGTQRNLSFPLGFIPNTVGDGDIVILPNGRMFASFGNSPSLLFELSNPLASGPMVATFLTILPRVCYSIAYVDGDLIVAGSDGGGCYYFKWDIDGHTLSPASTFPGGKSSADMTSMTVALGSTKQVVGMSSVNFNTARIYYRIVVKNKGNIALNNIQITDNLVKAFGAGNVVNTQVSMISNPGSLQLNPAYNGTTDVNLLLPGQIMDNHPIATDSVVLGLVVTATNLVANKVYYNSAVASGNIGAGNTYLAVSDSTNNGGAARMDLDGNGVSDDAGENDPTPYVFIPSLLPVDGLTLQGTRTDATVKLTWTTAAAQTFTGYEIERSLDGVSFTGRGTLGTQNGASYSFADDVTGVKATGVFYRIKALEADNSFVFSNTFYCKNGTAVGLSVYPNPFQSTTSVQLQTAFKGTATLAVKDIAGRTVVSKTLQVEKGSNYVTLSEMQHAQAGTYFIESVCGGEKSFVKVVKQ